MVATDGDGGADVFFVARNYYPDGDLAVVGAVGRVEGSGAFVETNFSAKMAAESGFKGDGIESFGMGRGWSSIWRHGVQTSSRIRALRARRLRNEGTASSAGAEFSAGRGLSQPFA